MHIGKVLGRLELVIVNTYFNKKLHWMDYTQYKYTDK